MTVEDPAEDF
jgi:hypothetical protein